MSLPLSKQLFLPSREHNLCLSFSIDAVEKREQRRVERVEGSPRLLLNRQRRRRGVAMILRRRRWGWRSGTRASECAASDGDVGIGSVTLALIYVNDVDARE